jgi:hypothetical protein
MNEVEQNFKSKKYYSSITGLDFHPREHVSVQEPKFKKGEVVSKRKFFFLKPKIKYAETDLYENVWHDWDGSTYKSLLNPKAYARNFGAHYDEKTGEFYRTARVVIKFEKNDETKYFMSNDEAFNFMRYLKEKCKLCGNELL